MSDEKRLELARHWLAEARCALGDYLTCHPLCHKANKAMSRIEEAGEYLDELTSQPRRIGDEQDGDYE